MELRVEVFHTLIQGDYGVFFQRDATYGLWGMAIRQEDQLKSASIAPSGQWLNIWIAQGVTGSPLTYCALGGRVRRMATPVRNIQSWIARPHWSSSKF